jgi:hypothetical protein
MVDLSLPDGVPSVYRGGPSLRFKPHEVKIDPKTRLVKITHGISVDADADRVANFGGAYRVRGLPAGLTIVQRGQRSAHYEIVPIVPVTPDRYQELLDQVDLELFQEEP